MSNNKSYVGEKFPSYCNTMEANNMSYVGEKFPIGSRNAMYSSGLSDRASMDVLSTNIISANTIRYLPHDLTYLYHPDGFDDT